MAHLGGRPRSRGQILLVTALILGVSFVALALILNSAIFTENLASRGDTTGADEVVTYQNNLQDGIGAVVAYETRNASTGDGHSTVLGRIETGMTDADAISVRRHAKQGATSNVSIDDHTDGTRIYQTNGSRNFTDATASPDWTLADSVDNARAFRFNVTGQPGTEQFVVRLDDGGDTWEVFFRDGGSNDVEIVVDNGTGEQRCDTVPTYPAEIDLTAGTVAGTACEALAFGDAPSGTYDVAFENGTEFTGTYSLVVDDVIGTSPPPAEFSADGNPSVSEAVYDLTLEYHYRTSDIVVGNHLRIAPGEFDGR